MSSSEALSPKSLDGRRLLPSCPARSVEGLTLPSELRDDMAADSTCALLIKEGSCLRRALMNQLDIWSAAHRLATR